MLLSFALNVIYCDFERLRFLLIMVFHFLILILNTKIKFELLLKNVWWILISFVGEFFHFWPWKLKIIKLFDSLQAFVLFVVLARLSRLWSKKLLFSGILQIIIWFSFFQYLSHWIRQSSVVLLSIYLNLAGRPWLWNDQILCSNLIAD